MGWIWTGHIKVMGKWHETGFLNIPETQITPCLYKYRKQYQMKPLTVYKASAGSGKTFTLAVEYIKLLIKNPWSFKNILAVTFTNKATEEMKLRILSQLYGIWKMLPDSDVYMKAVTTDLGIDAKTASRQAGTALNNLVHNYNYFRVETIDSFFQSILRNLARELDLTANLRISLNDAEVEEQAVNQLIEDLDTSSVVLKWLIGYIFSNIEENKSWNVIEQVKIFGRNIFQDFYKAIGEDLGKIISEQNFFDNYTKQLKLIRENSEKKMAGYAATFEAETRKAGLLPDSFAGKNRGICSYFNKLKSKDFSDARCLNSTLEKHLKDKENWCSKNSKDKDVILSLVDKKLMKLLDDAENERKKQWKLHSTADVTLRHLNKLRLLNSIETKVRELNDEANRFLLSDTQYLLHTLIKDNDTPFIFEKAGCQIEHIMIDEFQDTGSVQWQNFKILLKECMSHGREDDSTIRNLIVGDVKQSIYRWRSGDWRLLNNINGQFDYPEKNVEIRSLRANYRSEKNIIDFNNVFFSIAAKKEYDNELTTNTEETANELRIAYEDVCQSAKAGASQNGLVRVTLLAEDDYDENMLDSIENCIDELLEAEIPLNKIAILIRYNRHIPLIAGHFMKKRPELSIISDEAFRLDASLAVNTIIQALSLLTHPDDVLTKASLAVTYQKRILGSAFSDSDILTGATEDGQMLDSLLPDGFVKRAKELPGKPLLDIIEDIYSVFELGRLEEQSAYICAFYDQVTDFIGNNSGNISKFIDEWNSSIHKKTIQSDEINGIRLISIHKSKGLEFDNVIIPFCDWVLENSKTTLWCNPKVSPFNKLPLVPIDYSKKLLETIYADDYRNEHVQNSVDNLNLLYVAFTRASKNLFVFGRNNKEGKKANNRSEILCQCLPEVNDRLEKSVLMDTADDSAPVIFEYGNLFKEEASATKKNLSENVFLHKTELYNIKIETSDVKVKFKQSNKSRDFIGNKDDADAERDSYIKTGNVLHKLFSMIRTTADIDKVLRQLEFDGILYDNDITIEKMGEMLSKILSDERVADWFDPRWQVFNECNILSLDPETGKTITKRPDRVIFDGTEMKVIDFKFGKFRAEYESQVRQYMDLLAAMGYGNIKAYLWFVYTNEIKEVKH